MNATAALDLVAADPSVAVLDLRRHRGKAQLRGAVYYHPDHFLQAQCLALPIAHDQVILVYGDDAGDVEASVERLRRDGYRRAEAIVGGLDALEHAGARLEASTQEQPIPTEPDAGIPLV